VILAGKVTTGTGHLSQTLVFQRMGSMVSERKIKGAPNVHSSRSIAPVTITFFVSDIDIFVLKRDVKLQLTNYYLLSAQTRLLLKG